MGIGENFDKFTDSVKKYLNLKSDDVKLLLVENLSLLSSDVLSVVIALFFLSTAIFFALLAILILLSQYIGFILSSFVICTSLASIALVVYLFRRLIFANIFVARFCKMLFTNNTNDEKSELFENKDNRRTA